MKKINIKFYILLLTIITTLGCNTSFAGYDTIKAITVQETENYGIFSDKKKEEEKEDYALEANDYDLPDYQEDKTISNFFKKRKNSWLNRKNKQFEQENVSDETNISKSQTDEKVLDKNKFRINADKITYDDTKGNVYANGNIELIAKEQNVTLKADEAVLDKNSQTIKLKGNVKILKNGLEMSGDTLVVNLNEENVIMDNPVAQAYSFIINAQEGYLIANDVQMINGTISSTDKKEFPIIPKHFFRYAPASSEELYDPELQNQLSVNETKKTYRIDAKEVVITSYKDHNSIVLKDSNVYINNHKIIPKADIEILSDKENHTVETNAPELGTLRAFGTYLGYGIVRKLPKGQTLKLMPAVVYGDSRFGVGLIGRHRSRNSLLEAGYSTSTERFVARGLYRLGNGFSIRYGRNAYISEGFMGARRSGYAGQLAFEKQYIDNDLGINFRHSTYAGLFSDYKKKVGKDHYFATTRFRHNLELSKRILEYRNKEQDMRITWLLNAQASATLYGTGDTTGVVRVGSTIMSKIKKWESSISYYQGGIHGDSPLVFDKYRYGRSTIMFNEKFNFNNKFALGFSGAVSPNKDNYERDLITESRLYALIGPRDVKLAFSYDFVRDMGYIDLMFILGSETSKMNFEKLTTKNIDSSKQKSDFYKKAKTIKVDDI